jgi:uncharacterized membrane protein
MVSIVLTAPSPGDALGFGLWVTIWSLGTIMLVLQAFKAWRSALRGGPKQGALFMTLFSLPFIGGEILGLYLFGQEVSIIAGVAILAMALVNIVFHELLKAPTSQGRKVMDRIEGFQMYLKTAEEQRLNVLTPPDKTPELFEKYLPYAIALDAENQWAEKFEDVLARAAADSGYQPHWYHGRSFSAIGAAGLASSVGDSLSSAVSSSSTSPGSSSGSGGGGSSGGGGGGGGGGGW